MGNSSKFPQPARQPKLSQAVQSPTAEVIYMNENQIQPPKNIPQIENISNLDAISLEELKRVIWAIIRRPGIKTVFLGVCSYAGKPCFIGTEIHVLTVQDLHLNVSTGSCEEEKRCLNVSCPLNKTTCESYATAKKLSPTQKKLLKTNWKEFLEIIASYSPIAEICKQAYEKNPAVTAIHIPLKAKSSRIFKPAWNLSKKPFKGD